MTEETLLKSRMAARRAPAPAPLPDAAPPSPAWAVVAGLGTALALVGWADVALGLLPARPGNPDWEFGAMSGAVDALPLGTMGVGLLAAAAVARGSRGLLRVLCAAAWLLTLLVLAGWTVYLLSAPLVWKAVAPGLRGTLLVAMGKTSLLALTYMVLYAWLGWRCRQAARPLTREPR